MPNFSQDWMEFYYDEDWGVPDYPYGIEEKNIPQPKTIEQPTNLIPSGEAKAITEAQPVTEVKKASILEQIPTWGWIAIGIGALLLFIQDSKRR